MTEANDKLSVAIAALDGDDDPQRVILALVAIIEALIELLEETMTARQDAMNLLGEAIKVAREAVEESEAKT